MPRPPPPPLRVGMVDRAPRSGRKRAIGLAKTPQPRGTTEATGGATLRKRAAEGTGMACPGGRRCRPHLEWPVLTKQVQRKAVVRENGGGIGGVETNPSGIQVGLATTAGAAGGTVIGTTVDTEETVGGAVTDATEVEARPVGERTRGGERSATAGLAAAGVVRGGRTQIEAGAAVVLVGKVDAARAPTDPVPGPSEADGTTNTRTAGSLARTGMAAAAAVDRAEVSGTTGTG